MDFNDVEALERFALASFAGQRAEFLQAVDTVTTPGQAFLAGLHALELGDLAAAEGCLQRLKALEPYNPLASRLEALLALRKWPSDPAATTAYLQGALGLTFDHPAPALAAEEAAAADAAAGEQPGAASRRKLSSALDPSLYSDRAVLELAVRLARSATKDSPPDRPKPQAPQFVPMGFGGAAVPPGAPGAPPGARPREEDGTASGQRLASLLSPAGGVALLARMDELGLRTGETIQVVRSLSAKPRLVLAGHPALERLVGELLRAEQPAALQLLMSHMSSEQLEVLMLSIARGPQPGQGLLEERQQGGSLPQAASPTLVAAAVRKMYGEPGAIAGVAAAVDAAEPQGHSAAPHPTPVLTPTEADALRRRALDLAARLKAAGVPGEMLAWLEARALLPLASAAVWRVAAASARAAPGRTAAEGQQGQGQAEREALTQQAAELVGLLVKALAGCGLVGLEDKVALASYGRSALADAVRGDNAAAATSVGLGPALPPLPDPYTCASRLTDLLDTLLTAAAGSPQALLSPGGPLAGLFEQRYIARLLSEAMLKRGGGGGGLEPDWAAMYRDAGGDLAELTEAVGLELGRDNAAEWEGPDDDVFLVVTHKAVQHLSVLVYDIATESYYREQMEEVGMGIDLEGLGPTARLELPLEPAAPPVRQVRTRINLPQLKGRRGMWVVEVQGGGRQCRALVRRGALSAAVRPTAAGLALRLFREDGSGVEQPRVWLDGRSYAPNPSAAAGRGQAPEVLLPYRAGGAATLKAVLVDSGAGFASLMYLVHPTEEYQLQCGMLFEPEAAAGGRAATVPLLLQPRLTISSWTAPLSLLEEVMLTVVAEGHHGDNQAKQTFQNFNLGDGSSAAVINVRLPERAARVSVSLTARVRRVAPGPDGGPSYQDFSVDRTWELNGTEGEEDDVRDLHLSREAPGQGGGYCLRLLGRAGEPYPGVEVVVALTHEFMQQRQPAPDATATAPPALLEAGAEAGGAATEADEGQLAEVLTGQLVVKRTLVTDETGTLHLGNLLGITAVAAAVPPTLPGKLRRRYCWHLPDRLTGFVGEGEGAQGQPHSRKMRLTAVAGEGMRVSVPVPGLAGAAGRALLEADTDPAAAAGPPAGAHSSLTLPPLRRRLGLVLYSTPTAAALQGVQQPVFEDTTADAQSITSGTEVSYILDEQQHVAVHSTGHVEVSGLKPGSYMLYTARLDLHVSILVYPASSRVVPALPHVEAAKDDAAGQAAAPYSLAVGSGVVVPLSEAAPLQVAELSATAEGGVSARLVGSRQQLGAAVVHVVLSRFEAHGAEGSTVPRLGQRQHSSAPGTAFGLPTRGSFQSGRRLGDEVRYVLERRRLEAEGRVRPMPALVDRPSLLMQPWKVRETVTRVQRARAGEAFRSPRREMDLLAAQNFACEPASYRASFGAAPRMAHAMAYGAAPMMAKMRAAPPAVDVGTVALGFCPPALVIPNVPATLDEQPQQQQQPAGTASATVRLAPEQLAAAVTAATRGLGLPEGSWLAAGYRVVRLVAYTAPAGVPSDAFGALSYTEARTAVEPGGLAAAGAAATATAAAADPRVTLAMQRPFAAGAACLERRACRLLQPSSDLVIADSSTAKLQLYGTVGKVWTLYGSLLTLAPHSPAVPYSGNGAEHLADFACLAGWNRLSRDVKMERYGKLASRELALFTYSHDPAFFRAEVLPYLRMRLPSYNCFLDWWMAGRRGRELVDAWSAPHRYSSLTPLERVLLALEEDLVQEAAGQGQGQRGQGQARPHLSQLATDMRSRVRRSLRDAGAAECADVARRRFEIALSGPGQDRQEDDGAAMRQTAFEEVQVETAAFGGGGGMPPPPAPSAAPPPGAMPMAMAMVAQDVPGAVGGAMHHGADLAARRALAAEPAYKAPAATQEWAEAGWYKQPPNGDIDPASLSPESELWADLAEHLAGGGGIGPDLYGARADRTANRTAAFLPRRLESGGWTFTDCVLAVSVLGVGWEDSAPLSVSTGTRLTLTATQPSVAYVQQTEAAVTTAATSKTVATVGSGGVGRVLLRQRLMDPNLEPEEVPVPGTGTVEADGGGDEGGGHDGVEAWEAAVASGGPGSEVDVAKGAPLAAGRVYCYVVTATNSEGAPVAMDVTLQAPVGSVPLGGRPALWVVPGSLAPYCTQQLPHYYFYFPRQADGTAGGGGASGYGCASDGELRAAFPAAAASRGRLLAAAADQPTHLRVLSALLPPTLSKASAGGLSWSRLAALPAGREADEARLRYLREGDLSGADLGAVLWRCRNVDFWRGAVSALRSRRVWDEAIWSYSVLHRDEQALREYLPACRALADTLQDLAPAAGPLLGGKGPTAANGPTAADRFAHLEYWPLVNARAHALGGRRAILNDQVAAAWRQLLQRIAAVVAGSGSPDMEDMLAATYHLVLQDRPEEAQALVARLGEQAGAGSSPVAKLQLAYLRAWLVLADPTAGALELSAAAAGVRSWLEPPGVALNGNNGGQGQQQRESVDVAVAEGFQLVDAKADASGVEGERLVVLEPRWRTRMTDLAVALEEVAAAVMGAAPAVEGCEGSATAAAAAAAAAPVLELYDSPEGPRGAVVLEVAGVDQVILNAYDMDAELLFSVRPFDAILHPQQQKQQGARGDGGSGGLGKFALVRPSTSVKVDVKQVLSTCSNGPLPLRILPATPGAARLLLTDPWDMLDSNARGACDPDAADHASGGGAQAAPRGVMLLEAVAVGAVGGSAGAGAGGLGLQCSVTVYTCSLRVVAREAHGVVMVTHLDTGVPLSGAYVKAYMQTASGSITFHKDGYTDRRGLCDYWTLTSKPTDKVSRLAVFVSHPELGCSVLHVSPPLH